MTRGIGVKAATDSVLRSLVNLRNSSGSSNITVSSSCFGKGIISATCTVPSPCSPAQALARNPQDLALLTEVAIALGTARVPTHRAQLYAEILNQDGALRSGLSLAIRFCSLSSAWRSGSLRNVVSCKTISFGNGLRPTKPLTVTRSPRLCPGPDYPIVGYPALHALGARRNPMSQQGINGMPLIAANVLYCDHGQNLRTSHRRIIKPVRR